MSERTYRRGFGKEVNWAEFNQNMLTMMIPPMHQLIVAMDAVFVPKSGKRTPNIGWFFNGCQSRAEKGLEASVVSIVDVDANTAYSLLARQTPGCLETKARKKKRKGTTDNDTGESRIQFYLRHLAEAIPYMPVKVRYLVADGFYACRDFVNGVLAMNMHIISKLRRDASLTYLYTGPQKARGRRRTLGERIRWTNVDLKKWESFGEVEKDVSMYAATVYHNSLKRTVKVVLLETTSNKRVSRALLFSTDVDLSATDIVRFYKARFQIEFLFRDAKTSMGLNHCQARRSNAIDFHWNTSLTAVNLAKWLEGRPAEIGVFSAGSCKQKSANQHFLDTFITSLGLDLTLIKCHPAYQNACNYGVMNV